MPAEKKIRGDDTRMKVGSPYKNSLAQILKIGQVIIVGAGLGGLGAAIAILLAGHTVTVLESAAEIAEVSTYSASSSLQTTFPRHSTFLGRSRYPNPSKL
jgi:NADPH-dependent 2,4-dienoyl-CoA reductase/sulfur reductase-like enzyme